MDASVLGVLAGASVSLTSAVGALVRAARREHVARERQAVVRARQYVTPSWPAPPETAEEAERWATLRHESASVVPGRGFLS